MLLLLLDRFTNIIVKKGSGAMVIHTMFHKYWFTRSKVVGNGDTLQVHRQQDDFINLFLFFKIRKVG
jgi:hypothetical protein